MDNFGEINDKDSFTCLDYNINNKILFVGGIKGKIYMWKCILPSNIIPLNSESWEYICAIESIQSIIGIHWESYMNSILVYNKNNEYALVKEDDSWNANLKDSFLFSNKSNDLTKKNLSKSIFDLMNCFICLSPADNPLTCPYCNNFACKKCLEQYFGESKIKNCPICKREINLKDLKQNKIIKEIEEILNKNNNEKEKIKELSALISEKRNKWFDQTNYINNLIEKVYKYQEKLNKYKEEYVSFILNCKTSIEKTFEECNKKIEDLVNSLITYNNFTDSLIDKYNQINNNNPSDSFKNINVKKFINDILSLERNHFNDKTPINVEQYLNNSIKILPLLNLYNIKEMKLKEDFNSTFSGSHFKFGNYILKCSLNNENLGQIDIEFIFNLNKENNNKMSFLIYQIITFKNKKEILFPMKLIENKGKMYTYKCTITLDEFFELKNDEVVVKIKALIFTV